jgi:hypothetical protein
MKMPRNWRRSATIVRMLLYAGWGLGLSTLLLADDPPFSLVFALAGGLLFACGVVIASDGGRALADINRRNGPWLWPPNHRYLGVLLAVIGAGWVAFGVAGTVS